MYNPKQIEIFITARHKDKKREDYYLYNRKHLVLPIAEVEAVCAVIAKGLNELGETFDLNNRSWKIEVTEIPANLRPALVH